jgi:hypothetical protein
LGSDQLERHIKEERTKKEEEEEKEEEKEEEISSSLHNKKFGASFYSIYLSIHLFIYIFRPISLCLCLRGSEQMSDIKEERRKERKEMRSIISIERLLFPLLILFCFLLPSLTCLLARKKECNK